MDFGPVFSLLAAILVAVISGLVGIKIARVQADAALAAARQQGVPPSLSSQSDLLRSLLNQTHEDLTEADDERRQCERDLLVCAQARYRSELELNQAERERAVWEARASERDATIERLQERVRVLASDIADAERDIANARMLRMEAIARLQAAEARAKEWEQRTSEEQNGRLQLAAELAQAQAEMEALRQGGEGA